MVGYHEPSRAFALGTARALVYVGEAAARLAAHPACGPVSISVEDASAFPGQFAGTALEARPVAVVSRFNYNMLHVESLTLYAAD